MNRCKCVVWIALFTCAVACSTGHDDEADLASAGSEVVRGKRRRPPPIDAASPDSPLPSPDAPVDGGSGGGGDGGSGDGGSGDGGSGDGGGSTPSFIDACLLPGMSRATFYATGPHDAHDEGATAALNLPFPFTLNGTAHSKYWITTNGQLGFGSTAGGSAFGQVTCPLPDARFTKPIVLVYSVDLVGRLDPEAGVCYATTGTAPNRKLVVTWKDSFFYEAWLTSHVTFSAVLHEGTNAIDVMIGHVDAPDMSVFEAGGASVLGKQSGSSAYAYSCFQPRAPEGTIVHYNP